MHITLHDNIRFAAEMGDFFIYLLTLTRVFRYNSIDLDIISKDIER